MAQSIKNLALGSKIQDSKGNKFIVIAKNHYASNEVTLLSEQSVAKLQMSPTPSQNTEYPNTEVAYYLNNDYLKTLDNQLQTAIKVTSLPYSDSISGSQFTSKTVYAKAFILSTKEIGVSISGLYNYPNETTISYMNDNRRTIFTDYTWLRTENATSNISHFFATKEQYTLSSSLNSTYNVQPVFNLSDNVLISDDVSAGYYSFIFNAPPVISTIQNMQGNFGSSTRITYTVTDSDDSNLTHYISFDNGGTWQPINPTRNSNMYTYSHVFNELGGYNTRIKVVDSANNVTTSNLFVISVNAVAPTVNIVSVVDKVITFKTNCITSEMAKVEILINDEVVKTFTSGFDFDLVYEIDRNNLIVGKNSIQIKATSKENLIGYASLEASKVKYNLPPNGTKVIIGGAEYSISNASENGNNQTYTLSTNLINQVNKGDIVKVNQDFIKVLCSISNLENSKDFKEMKLVKTKKLKGDFEGYVEEKYELECEGRYSAIKLETERFNNIVESEIIELQQYFDYLED